jgi:hypothetical protein
MSTLSSLPAWPRPELDDSGQNMQRQEGRHLGRVDGGWRVEGGLGPFIQWAERIGVGGIGVAFTAGGERRFALAGLRNTALLCFNQ